MCMGGNSTPPEPDPLPPTPRKDENSATSQTARDSSRRMGGAMDNVGLSPTGDPNYGQNAQQMVTLLGATRRV